MNTRTVAEIVTAGMIHDRLRGHWAREDGVGYGCACPTPPEAPATRLTVEQLERFEKLTHRFVWDGWTHLTQAEQDEYKSLHKQAFPHHADGWRRVA